MSDRFPMRFRMHQSVVWKTFVYTIFGPGAGDVFKMDHQQQRETVAAAVRLMDVAKRGFTTVLPRDIKPGDLCFRIGGRRIAAYKVSNQSNSEYSYTFKVVDEGK
jgi:hypothetical protein